MNFLFILYMFLGSKWILDLDSASQKIINKNL